MKPRELPFEVEHLGDVTVVHFTCQSLLDRPTLREAVEQFDTGNGSSGKGQLLFNFACVELLGSQALAELIVLKKEVEEGGGRFILCNLHPLVEEVFRVTRLDKFFHLPRHHLDRSGVAAIPFPDSVEPSYMGMMPRSASSNVMPAVICDPVTARASRLIKGLSPDLSLVHFADLEALQVFCQKFVPLAIAMPLQGFPTTLAGKESDSPVLRFIRAHGRQTAILIYAEINRLPIEMYCRALAAGARHIIHEEVPTFIEDLKQVLQRLIQTNQVQTEEREQLIALFAAQGLCGRSPAMLEVFRRGVKAAQFDDLPVLLLGETGTGKQRLAEAIHRLDPKRGQMPFLTVNCSTINKTLAESELFGHKKGAFTGAQNDRPGLFRMAHGGTLLLDEIGELDLDLQPKLLRVLQDQRLLPVGADYEHAVDVRIIAATNRPLEKMVESGQFRSDLYQRLNVFQIRIPPLRERPEDIEVQARHFLSIYQMGHNQRVIDFGLRVLEALRLLPWEGNSRQLENLIRETLAHKDHGTLLQMEDLPPWVVEKLAQLPPPLPAADSLDLLVQKACEQQLSLTAALEEYERRLLQVVLERNNGNRTHTAAQLGLTARSIFNKIKKYQLG